MIRTKSSNAKEIQIEVLLSKIRDVDNNINDAGINKLTTIKGYKEEVDILPMLVVVIANRASTKNAAFIIDLIIDIGFLFVSTVGAGIKKVVEGKIVRALTKVGNADEVVAGWEPEG